MNVFISQPMRGLSETEITVVREKIFEEFKLMHPDAVLIDNLIMDPSRADLKDVIHPEIVLLAMSIDRMADADVVLFAKGWENYPGCRVENRIARYYGLKIAYA